MNMMYSACNPASVLACSCAEPPFGHDRADIHQVSGVPSIQYAFSSTQTLPSATATCFCHFAISAHRLSAKLSAVIEVAAILRMRARQQEIPRQPCFNRQSSQAPCWPSSQCADMREMPSIPHLARNQASTPNTSRTNCAGCSHHRRMFPAVDSGIYPTNSTAARSNTTSRLPKIASSSHTRSRLVRVQIPAKLANGPTMTWPRSPRCTSRGSAG